MKKTIFISLIVPLSAMILSSCVLYNGKGKDGKTSSSTSVPTTGQTTSEPTSEPTSSTSTLPPTPTGQVNLYLVLGPYGKLDDNFGTNIESKFLENAVAITVDIGSNLPDKNHVKSVISGSTFSHWVNRETTQNVTTAPEKESILVAVFEGGEGGNIPVPPGGLPTEGYGFLFETAPGSDPYYKLATYFGPWTDGEGRTFEQYQISDFELVKGQKFALYDFTSQGSWTINLDGYSCGGASSSDTKWEQYLNKTDNYYEVKQTFTTNGIYLKLLYQQDQLFIGI